MRSGWNSKVLISYFRLRGGHMTKVILNLAISLDGFIARKNGAVDFLGEMPSDLTDESAKEAPTELPDDFAEFIDSIDTIIMGRKAYEVTMSLGDYLFKDKITYVCTSKSLEVEDYIYTTNEEVDVLVERLKSESGKNIWLFGGSELIDSFIKKELIDEYQITIVPYVIRQGIPLFKEGKYDTQLKLVDSQVNQDFVTLTYVPLSN